MELAAVDERLKENLPSIQLSTILDNLLYNSLYPILFKTNNINLFISDLLSQLYDDHRRKFSGIGNKKKVDNLLSIFLLTDNINLKIKILKKLGLDRSILTQCIDYFLNTSDNETLKDFCNVYYKEYLNFKSMIVEKYIRLAYLEASKSVKGCGLSIDQEELFKNLLLAVCKAIDKYNPDKGALTSYIQWWFKDAKTNPEFQHTYNQSYSVSATGRKKIVSNFEAGSSETNISQRIEDVEENLLVDNNNAEIQLEANSSYAYLVSVINKIPRKNMWLFSLLNDVPIKLRNKEVDLFNKLNQPID